MFEANSVREVTCSSRSYRFRKAPFSKCFLFTLKRKACIFKLLRFEEAPLPRQISVDGRPVRGGSRERVRGCAPPPPRDEAFFVFAFKICLPHLSVAPFLSGAPPPKKNPWSTPGPNRENKAAFSNSFGVVWTGGAWEHARRLVIKGKLPGGSSPRAARPVENLLLV